MNPQASSSNTKSSYACVRCSERKVKCDRQNPCEACVRHNVQCIFRSPKPPRRRPKSIKHESLHERLKLYESLLAEKGIDPDIVGTRDQIPDVRGQIPTPSSIVSEQSTIFKPQLLHGQTGTKLVNNSLWSRVADEIHEDDEDSANDASDELDDFGYVLGSKTLASSHPPVDLIHRLWQVFLENVNPVTKLVHIPSLQPAMDKAISNLDHVPKGFEALMFAIYSMAVLSLAEDECKTMLGESRAILLPHYIAATKAALSRANFMSTTSIVVLQALVLHIFSIRSVYEPRAVWTFTGLAIRIAENLGMRLDGTLLGLSPFETEMRRRIWWQISFHDFRAAELSGQSKIRAFEFDETMPKLPANVNDSDLHPSMSQAPTESTGPTEMLWVMMRSELASFASSMKARLGGKSIENAAPDDLKAMDSTRKDLEEILETKYLRYCDPTQPLHLWTMIAARLSLTMARFIAHHPRKWTDQVSPSEQQLVWSSVIQLLEQYNMMQSNPLLRRFAWGIAYFIQWHAVIHILDTLRAQPEHPDATKAWGLVDVLYENNLDNLLSDRPIFLAVGNLCLKAFNGRKIATPPDYIIKLRQVREAAKARRELRKQATTENLEPQRARKVESGDEPFLFDGSGMMDMDADAMFAQEWLDTPDDENLDWAQWDHWFGSLPPTVFPSVSVR